MFYLHILNYKIEICYTQYLHNKIIRFVTFYQKRITSVLHNKPQYETKTFFQGENGNGSHHLTVTSPILGTGTQNYSEVLLDSGVGSDLGVNRPQHHQVAAGGNEVDGEQQHLLETAL